MIKIRASGNGQKLCVKEFSSEHNHELSKVCVHVSQYTLLPVHLIGSIYAHAQAAPP